MAAALALDGAFGVSGDTPARTASRLLRNLVHGACYLESAILHFYLLSLPDFIPALPMAPWLPGWDVGRRFDPATLSRFTGHFVAAIAARRNATRWGRSTAASCRTRPAYIAGGFTAVSSPADKTLFSAYLDELITFIQTKYIPDAELLANLYSEYLALGKGYGNLLAFGVFELDNAATPAAAAAARAAGRTATRPSRRVDAAPDHRAGHAIPGTADATDNQHPGSRRHRARSIPKGDAYSWLKAPRYGGVPYEVGPLARMTVNGDYTNGISVMDRHLARAREALKIALAMRDWLAALPRRPERLHRPAPIPATATARA